MQMIAATSIPSFPFPMTGLPLYANTTDRLPVPKPKKKTAKKAAAKKAPAKKKK